MRRARRRFLPLAALLAFGWSCGEDGGLTTPGTAPPVPTTLTLSPATVSFTALGDTRTLSATVRDQYGVVMPSAAVSWSSESPDVAAVLPGGVVSARAEGVTRVTARAGDVSAVAAVSVRQEVASVELTGGVDTLTALGDSARLTATARDANGVEVGGRSVVWSTSAPDVALVDGVGVVTAAGDGRASIRAGIGGMTAEWPLVVEQRATALALVAQPGGAAARVPLTTQPRLELRDARGHRVAADSATEVVASIEVGSGSLTGSATASSSAGVVSFEGLAIDGAVGPFVLRFEAAGLDAVRSDTVALAAGPPAALTVSTEPGPSARSGAPLEPQPAVRLLDGSGNPVDMAGVAVRVEIEDGGGTLDGDTIVSTDGDGVATFGGLSITGVLGPRRLRFTAGTLEAATSDTVRVDAPGPASALALVTQPPASAAVGEALSPQPSVALVDVSGNAVESIGVTVTAAIATGDGSLEGTPTALTGADGVATFADLAIVGAAGMRTLIFSAAGLSPVTTDAVQVGVGAAAGLSIVTQPGAAAGSGVPLSPQPALRVVDAGGNPVDTVGLAVLAGIASGGGVLEGTTEVVTGAGGAVTYTDLVIVGAPGPRILEFVSGGLTSARSDTVSVASGPPAALVMVTEPSATVVDGVPLLRQPAVRLVDGTGNPVAEAGLPITVTVASGPGTLTGGLEVETDAAGVASFAELAIDGAGEHTLAFSGVGLSDALSDTVTVFPLGILENGVTETGLGASAGVPSYFVFSVPQGAPEIEITISGGSGNADLHVLPGEVPTTTSYDCAPRSADNEESCFFTDPEPGDWYVLLDAVTTYVDVSLTASVTGVCTLESVPDTDGDRLPDCVETNTGLFLSAFDTGTDPFAFDTDGDAIDDGDEVLGTLGGLDLPGLGVSPLVPTILVEYDWFDDGGHSHRPTQAQLDMVTASFAAQGIEVIHDYGQGPAPFDGGNFIDDADGNVDGFGAEFYGYKAANFDANRDGYFHYALHPHRYNNGNSSGLAELFGDDLITATHNFYDLDLPVAGTIQHELGHNLGLFHGGDVGTNRKPNYNSVMNYNYQFFGVDADCTPPEDGVLDYSYGTRPDLNENDLDETRGICGGSPGWDWNQDGDATDTGVVADINRDWGSTPPGAGDGSFGVLSDHDDWSALYYAGISDGDGAVFDLAPMRFEICPIPPQALMRRRPR